MPAPIEPEMYPLTDHPDYSETFEHFNDTRTQLEDLPEGLNFIVSWFIYDEHDPDFRKYDPTEQPEFQVLVFLPRKTKTTVFRTNQFDRTQVEAWLNGPVRERTMRWYGWDTSHA